VEDVERGRAKLAVAVGRRPGWHIECSAMNCKQLGNHFDIHGGGSDLMFPHHENEIAQSTCAHDGEYVNYWMHSGMVMVDREKMSKSLGNFFTVRDVLKFYDAETIRYFLMSGHYRSQLNYSEENLKQARSALERLYTALREPIKPQSRPAARRLKRALLKRWTISIPRKPIPCCSIWRVRLTA
jgi:cysteinyl-tRNA synthetase